MASSSVKNEDHIDNSADSKECEGAYNPEDSDSEMVIKPFCECQNCLHWKTSADWTTPQLDFESHPQKLTPGERNIQPLLRSAIYPGRSPKIFHFNPCNPNKFQQECMFKILVHGETIPQPVNTLVDTYFHEDIQMSLEALKYKYSMPIQAFVWPALFRQLNVCMISHKHSGKTMGYLPVLCTLCTNLEEKHQELAKHKGPLAIILCSNSKQCEEIFDLIKKIYSNISKKPKVSIITYPTVNINATDILITLPDSLMYCLESKMFNLKRLCYLVLEDASVLIQRHKQHTYKVLNIANEMLEHRTSNSKIQLIMSSERWSVDLKQMLQLLYVCPLICIGNHLEAALYGNIQFELKYLQSNDKNIYLTDLLKGQYCVYKSVIFCKDSKEIYDVEKWLMQNGIETIVLDTSNAEHLEQCKLTWNVARGGNYKVLICTDSDESLFVNDAVWLINYSFPNSWTRFAKRFSALSSLFKSPLISHEEKLQCKSVLMIDETSNKQMPRILNLLNRLGQELPQGLQNYAATCKAERETEKLHDNIAICKKLKLFGRCSDTLCEMRHVVNNGKDVSRSLPKSGKIVFKILNMKDVTHYVVQLIKHTELDGTVHYINGDDLQKPLIFGPDIERVKAKSIKLGEFYVHCDSFSDGEVFMLCNVLSIPNSTFVEVKLTTGVTMQTLQSKLYEIPENLKIVDVLLCNLIPPHKDQCFSGRSYHVTRTSLESLKYKTIELTGDVFLQLDGMLWVNNATQTVRTNNVDVIKLNLTKHLLQLKVVQLDSARISGLHQWCRKCGIELPSYVQTVTRKTTKVVEIEAQKSFLDETVQEVILISAVSPEEFYVQLYKYKRLLDELEQDINTAVSKESLKKNFNAALEKYCLAPNPDGNLYSRARILQIQNEKALCFYVDYGDEAVVDVSSLKHLPNKFIKKIPFQAIQCRLHGVVPVLAAWNNESTDLLYKYMFESDSDIFRSFFVKVCDKVSSDLVRADVKYSVLLKNGLDSKGLLLNQLMVDCGFAKFDNGELHDFVVPPCEDNYSSGSDHENSSDEILQRIETDFDFEVNNIEEFLKMMGFEMPPIHQPVPNTTDRLAICDVTNDPETSENSTASSKSTALTPEVYWSQTEKDIKLKIKLIGVETYKASVFQKKVFTFWTRMEEKVYELKFMLHKTVDMGKHRALGQEVQVILHKVEQVEWLQLTGTKKRMRNIHYEVPDDADKKQKRKFLQLDITDDESDGDDRLMYHEVSDLDSEFDQEVWSSSE